jgi:4-amino-4-deoxychorismate lyase
MILVNGVAADNVAATDRGLAYGDGVFRTLVLRQGRARQWARHYRKLAHDCAALAIACPPEALLAGEVAQLARHSPDAVVKIIVTRGSGARGYAPPQPSTLTRIVMDSPVPGYPEEFVRAGVAVHVCQMRLSSQPRLAGVKHLNRLENVLARAEWNDPAVPEGILLDAEEHVVGGTMTNLFIVEDGGLVTPPLLLCGVAGVTRERIMQGAGRLGMACREEPVTLPRLLGAQEALLVNSVIGAWQVKSCAGRGWEPGDRTRRVREWLDEEGD